jgi:enamine deaminase RidA (YjgF/YER057c/UK114 family)
VFNMTIQRYGTTRRFSDVVVHEKTAYLVEVPANLTADVSAQTANMLASVERQLAEVGSDKSRLLMVTLYLADMASYDAVNAVWDAWLPAGTAPVRACVQAQLAHPQYQVEIALTAALVEAP